MFRVSGYGLGLVFYVVRRGRGRDWRVGVGVGVGGCGVLNLRVHW